MAIQVSNHNYKFTSLRSCTLRSLPQQRRGRRRAVPRVALEEELALRPFPVAVSPLLRGCGGDPVSQSGVHVAPCARLVPEQSVALTTGGIAQGSGTQVKAPESCPAVQVMAAAGVSV